MLCVIMTLGCCIFADRVRPALSVPSRLEDYPIDYQGGKRHTMPCHHNLEEYLTGYLDGASLRGDLKGLLFRTIGRGTGKLTRTVLPQANAYAMIGRRAAADGIATKQPQLPGDGDHRVSQEWRYARKGRSDGKPRLDAHDAALRSPA
jgi:hypothetical protein